MEGAAGSVFTTRQKPSNMPTEIVERKFVRSLDLDEKSLQNSSEDSKAVPQNFHLGIGTPLNKITVDEPKEQSNPSYHADKQSDQEWCNGLFTSYLINISEPHPPHCTIFQAPNYMIKDSDEKTFKPTVVTFGLFHNHESKQLLPQLHKLKSKCVSYLLARHQSKEREKLLELCMDLVLTLEPRARSCYSIDRKDVGRQKFAEMMLHDGCFILYCLLEQKISGSQEDKAHMSELKRLDVEITASAMTTTLWIWNIVMYDLLKLENQIPFFVLQSLFDLLKTPADDNLVELALKYFSNIYPPKAKEFKSPQSSEVLHLLHLFHSSLIPPKLSENRTMEKAPDWIPSATVLRDAGIKFQAPKEGTAKSFLEVTFEGRVMEIPHLQVDDNTRLVFRNLIVFEQCYLDAKNHITTYIRFMKYLMNTKVDIRLLSIDEVLLNQLGTEDAAVDLLSQLCDQVYYTPNMNYLSKVFIDVTKYYRVSWHKWRAEFFSTYFKHPWAIMSGAAAIALLLLTLYQAAFATLSYFRSPKAN